MVKYAEKNGISKTARDYRTTRLTVRKWIKRYNKEGLTGLKDKSRAPHHIPHKTPKEIEQRVIELRKTHPAWGPERLKMHYEFPISTKAIGRIIRHAGLVRKRRRKWRKQRDLREVKKKLNALQFIQIDTKDLSDILKYWTQMRRLGLPRYMMGGRDVTFRIMM
jgi:transposase